MSECDEKSNMSLDTFFDDSFEERIKNFDENKKKNKPLKLKNFEKSSMGSTSTPKRKFNSNVFGAPKKPKTVI